MMPDLPGTDADDDDLAVDWNLDAAYDFGDFDTDDEEDESEEWE